MPGISPQNVGMLKPTDLLGALSLFAGKYESEG